MGVKNWASATVLFLFLFLVIRVSAQLRADSECKLELTAAANLGGYAFVPVCLLVCLHVCLHVCMSAGYLERVWMDFHKIFVEAIDYFSL